MAEDIKMNVFPQVTSAEYIYGELVDGSQIKIKKSLFNRCCNLQ